MEELLKLLESFHPVATELQLFLLHNLPKEVHRANKPILEEGQVCDWVAFVEKGLLKIYYECDDLTERIVWFHKEGDVMGSMKSYYSGQPSKLTIRTMEETHIRKIRKSDLEALMLLAMPPKERYKKIKEEYPWILKDARIKDYMLAAYLGMDKATLSRYRNQ